MATEGTSDFSNTALIDHYSQYVHTNTTHLGGFTYYRGEDVLGMFQYLQDFLTGETTEVRSFHCGDRAQVLRVLLVKAGMSARLVNIATDAWDDQLNGHILVEVLNPDTQDWELIDPDFGVHYETSGRRIGLIEAVTMGPSSFVACKHNVCDWAHADILRVRDYFQFGLQVESETTSVLLNISHRFNTDLVFSSTGRTVLEEYSDYPIVFR